jgi:GNAT superfamily N-acetyltransferase
VVRVTVLLVSAAPHDDPAVLDAADADAVIDLFGHMHPDARARLGASVSRLGDGVAVSCTALASPVFNRVLGIGSMSPATRADIRRAADHYGGLEIANWAMMVADAATPPAFTSWLDEAGLRPGLRSAKLWHSMDALPGRIGNLVVRRTDDTELVAEVLTEAYGSDQLLRDWWQAPIGKPTWQHYAAWREHRVVAVAALRLAPPVAWLGFAGALPEARRLGAQSALIAHRLRAAADAGCRIAVAETADDTPDQPNPSFRNLMHLGFRLAYRRTSWLAGPDVH